MLLIHSRFPVQVESNVAFREMTNYMQLPSGRVTVGIRTAVSAGRWPDDGCATGFANVKDSGVILTRLLGCSHYRLC